MRTTSNPALARFIVRGGWLVVKSTFNSVLATVVLALVLVASLAS
jgi:hypothetical protein